MPRSAIDLAGRFSATCVWNAASVSFISCVGSVTFSPRSLDPFSAASTPT